jgi:hypothetical protein
MYKKLYINGCSFTAGNNLSEKEIWPYHLSKKLNLELINHSINGNSMQSIAYHSVNYLSTLDSNETLVVIGLTWPTRYMVSLLDSQVNVTPSTFGREDVLLSRRLHPYSIENLKKYGHEDYRNNLDVVEKFTDYYKSQIKNNSDQLHINQLLNHYTQIVYLQSFLKANKFNYTFINFGSFNDNKQLEDSSNFPIFESIDKSKIIKLEDNKYNHEPTCHPTAEQCKEISNIVFNVIK